MNEDKVFVSALLIASVLCISLYTNSAFAYDLKEYCPLHEGNSATYVCIEDGESYEETVKVGDGEVINGTKTHNLIYYDDGEYVEDIYIAIDSEGLKVYMGYNEDECEIYNPPLIIFPNTETKKPVAYSSNMSVYDIEGNLLYKEKVKVIVTFIGIEDVVVPAGKFTQCIKFYITYEWKKEGKVHGEESGVLLLAPGVGIVKQAYNIHEYDEVGETKKTYSELCRLKTAIIDGKKIGKPAP